MGFVDDFYWFLACGAFFMFHYVNYGIDIAFEMFIALTLLSILVYWQDIKDFVNKIINKDD